MLLIGLALNYCGNAHSKFEFMKIPILQRVDIYSTNYMAPNKNHKNVQPERLCWLYDILTHFCIILVISIPTMLYTGAANKIINKHVTRHI